MLSYGPKSVSNDFSYFQQTFSKFQYKVNETFKNYSGRESCLETMNKEKLLLDFELLITSPSTDYMSNLLKQINHKFYLVLHSLRSKIATMNFVISNRKMKRI